MTDWESIDGWLSREEGAKLAELASGKCVLELGAYKGRSTVAMANEADAVVTIDTFDGRGGCGDVSTLAEFERSLDGRDNVTYHVQHHAYAETLTHDHFDLIFIDGSHDEASVYRDATNARRLLRAGGFVAFHDIGDSRVQAACDRAGFVEQGRIHNLAWGKFD